MTLRIANVIEEGKLGGPQVRMIRVAQALEGRAETLIVMPRANSAAFRSMCRKHGVKHCAMPLTRITKEPWAALAFILFSPAEVARLVYLFKRERVDIVHASGGSWQYKALLAARLATIPCVWHINDTYMPRWVRGLFRLLSPLASGFIFASSRSQDYYGGLIRSDRPKSVVPSTVDTRNFSPSMLYIPDPDLAGIADGPVVGTIANINPIKDFETLIMAVAHLRVLGHRPNVVIVGPVYRRQRSYYLNLLSLAKRLGVDRLHFVGGRADVRPILATFDVYVCSSLAESSPVSVWEAMSMGRPIVATDVGDISLHVREGKEGFVVPVGSDRALADRLSILLGDPELRARIGASARCAAQAFSPERVADLTQDLYNHTLRHS